MTAGSTREERCRMPMVMRRLLIFGAILALSSGFFLPAEAANPDEAVTVLDPSVLNNVYRYIGPKDAVLLADASGAVLAAKNVHTPLIPASTLKVLTALVSLHYLGADHRFKTVFYTDADNNLIIKGFGDPLLISEAMNGIARTLAEKCTKVSDIVLDATHFTRPLTIPGISDSLNPYDAPNGALCANFNTVAFKRSTSGAYVSAEPQTPLIPFVLPRIRATGQRQGRITLSSHQDACTRYAGHLFSFFLSKHGLIPDGGIRLGKANPKTHAQVYTYFSDCPLPEVIEKMLTYSNNFMANQLLIAASAKAFGAPGSLEKGEMALAAYCRETIGTDGIHVVEGSGISRDNRITAAKMAAVLAQFRPYQRLMRKENNVFFKTGTLNGIRTRIGYIQGGRDRLYPFCILLNTPGKSDAVLLKRLLLLVQRIEEVKHQEQGSAGSKNAEYGSVPLQNR